MKKSSLLLSIVFIILSNGLFAQGGISNSTFGTLGVLDLSIANNSVFIYPNPVTQNETLQYTLTNEEPVLIRLLDMQGNVVQTLAPGQMQEPGEHNQPLNLSEGLASGSYVIAISTPDGQMSIKIVK